MKAWPLLAMVLCLGLFAQDRPFEFSRTDHHKIVFQLRSDSIIQKQGSVVILRGHTKITTQGLTVSADEMEFNQDTGEIEPRGNVRVQLYSRHRFPSDRR